MDIIRTDDVEDTAYRCRFNARNGHEELIIFIPSKICALESSVDPINKDYVKTRGIKCINLGNAGGCIVAFPGNVELGHFSKDLDNTFIERLTEAVLRVLENKGLYVTKDNNDLLINGVYKVFSTSRAIYNKSIAFSAVHISINCDTDIVRKICTKPMVKIPKGLSEYGITTEEVLALILEVFKNS